MDTLKKYKLPRSLRVHVEKGVSGALLAELSDLNVYTQSDSLNDLFEQINDLIYEYYNIPKKVQENVRFIPTRFAQYELLRIEKSEVKVNKEVQVNQFVLSSLHSSVTHGFA